MLYVDPPENRFLWMDFPAPERTETLSNEDDRPHLCFSPDLQLHNQNAEAEPHDPRAPGSLVTPDRARRPATPTGGPAREP